MDDSLNDKGENVGFMFETMNNQNVKDHGLLDIKASEELIFGISLNEAN